MTTDPSSEDSVFFLKSKRFWSMPAGALVGWGVAELAKLGLEISAEQEGVLIGAITAALIWLVGMAMGKREVRLGGAKSLAPMIALLAAVGMVVSGCVSLLSGAETPGQRLFAAKADYLAVVISAEAYESQPRCTVPPIVVACSKSGVVGKLRAADNVAYAAIKGAEQTLADATASDQTIQLVLEALRNAVAAYRAVASDGGVRIVGLANSPMMIDVDTAIDRMHRRVQSDEE